jgi:penicillin amidase
MFVRVAVSLVTLIVLLLVGVWLSLPDMNDRKTSGTLELAGLEQPVRVVRDGFGVPYIYAETLEDAFRAQGFVVGQDRLFQIELLKRASTGRLAEVLGRGPDDVIFNLDKEVRVAGFHRLAHQQVELYSPNARSTLSAYLDGLNAYIETRSDTHPIEFQLAGFEPEVLTESDLVAVMFYLGWASSANFDAELIALDVIDAVGAESFSEIAPIVINPDDPAPIDAQQASLLPRSDDGIGQLASWTQNGWRQLGMGGSNNWAFSGDKVGQTAAVVTNDPHLDSRMLPGPWHPVGIITPDTRAVGVSMGMPGIVVGRNEHVAFGVTNAYADAVDLYIETVDPNDPDRYMEGDVSVPFETLTEQINWVQDGILNAETIMVRRTRRGPVITDHSPHDDRVISVRWASAEFFGDTIGIDALFKAQSAEEFLDAVKDIHSVSLNFVVGDTSGRIGRQVSGVAPIRLRGDGMVPFEIVDDVDNWGGRIPADEMPGEIDPLRGWTGTANHMTAPADYPYVYTTYASSTYRYRRMQELFEPSQLTAEDGWNAQYDILNVFARDIAPILASGLSQSDDADLQDTGAELAGWNFQDDKALLAPTLFHETVRQLAIAIFEDELGADVTAQYLSNWYVWQERFDAIVQDGTSDWIDDKRTPETESLSDLVERAGTAALARLSADYGDNRSNWFWGKVHQTKFSGPLRLDGFAGQLTGNRDVPVAGSGETLQRGLYPFKNPFNSQWHASLRMTADLNDSDKVRAILPGGAVGRTFNRHLADQNDYWADRDAEPTHWWFSDEMIEANAKTELILVGGRAP